MIVYKNNANGFLLLREKEILFCKTNQYALHVLQAREFHGKLCEDSFPNNIL